MPAVQNARLHQLLSNASVARCAASAVRLSDTFRRPQTPVFSCALAASSQTSCGHAAAEAQPGCRVCGACAPRHGFVAEPLRACSLRQSRINNPYAARSGFRGRLPCTPGPPLGWSGRACSATLHTGRGPQTTSSLTSPSPAAALAGAAGARNSDSQWPAAAFTPSVAIAARRRFTGQRWHWHGVRPLDCGADRRRAVCTQQQPRCRQLAMGCTRR